MPLAARVVFFVVFLSLMVVAHAYLYRRLVVPLVDGPRVRRGLLLAAATLMAAGVVVRLWRPFDSAAGRWLGLTLLSYLGFFLYLLLVAVAGHAVEACLGYARRRAAALAPSAVTTQEERRRFLTGSLAAGSAVLAGGVGAFGTWRAYHPPEVTDVPVRLPFLPAALEGFTLVHLTDVHVGMVIDRKFLAELVRSANRARPDLVVITGDLVDGPVSRLGPTVAALQGLEARYGRWFVTGNHDYYSGANAWASALAGLGITPLRNRHVSIGEGQASFDLVGVDDWHARRFGEGYDLDRALAGRRPDRASVLLAHQPSNFEEVASRGVGLQLSGHTHGGQMFPGTTIASAIWGDRARGLSSLGGSSLYVSRGCGFVGPPMRIGSAPEIARITLLRA